MTYLETLIYQERTMNDLLCQQWIGFRNDRETFRYNLVELRRIIKIEQAIANW